MELRWKSSCNARPSVTSRQHTASRLTVRPVGSSASSPGSMHLGRDPVETSRGGSGTCATRALGLPHPDQSGWCCAGYLQRGTDRIRPRGRPVPVVVDGRRAPMRRSVLSPTVRRPRRSGADDLWSRSGAFRGFVACARSADLGGCPDSARADAADAAGPSGYYRTSGSPSDAWASFPGSVHSQPSEQIGDPSDVHSWSAKG
jgi:hypothetical protein